MQGWTGCATGWGQIAPNTIRPDPRYLYLTLTADCNLRCQGLQLRAGFHAGA